MEQIRFFPAVLRPGKYFGRYRESEEKNGYWWRMLVLLCVSGLINALVYYASFDSQKNLPFVKNARLSGTDQEVVTYLLSIAGGIWGIMLPVLIIAGVSFAFYPFFKDIGMKGLFFIFSILYTIVLLNELIELPFQLAAGEGNAASPAGLGFIGTALFKDGFFARLFDFINVLYLWGFAAVYSALKQYSFKKKQYILSVTALLFVLWALMVSLLEAVKAGQLF
ncbi:hypothetical protein ACFFJY_12870 [Fictibacillus aquaticus]|uniref:Yip1 domain-containing protein n=1 Tax=Fictibacillus aquaticus TaxID=2021314 RepID=A0A235FDW3_9BACL|nr:hypothetical protein [Fictibacillus aquaticus]OYD59124.1 hypothetical protein CGZ90_04290 [Fictibacillus aquaticus]